MPCQLNGSQPARQCHCHGSRQCHCSGTDGSGGAAGVAAGTAAAVSAVGREPSEPAAPLPRRRQLQRPRAAPSVLLYCAVAPDGSCLAFSSFAPYPLPFYYAMPVPVPTRTGRTCSLSITGSSTGSASGHTAGACGGSSTTQFTYCTVPSVRPQINCRTDEVKPELKRLPCRSGAFSYNISDSNTRGILLPCRVAT